MFETTQFRDMVVHRNESTQEKSRCYAAWVLDLLSVDGVPGPSLDIDMHLIKMLGNLPSLATCFLTRSSRQHLEVMTMTGGSNE